MRSERDGESRASDAAAAARRRILADHRETIASVLSAADAVAARWDRPHATDGRVVVEELRSGLDRRGLGGSLVTALADGVAAAGYELEADPVPAPPYVVVASTGPILRGTVEGGRLVVAVEAFAVDRPGGPDRSGGGVPADAGDDATRYVRRGDDPETALCVRFHDRGGPA